MIKVIEKGYLGTQTPYIYQKSRYTPTPKGYRPFYINHIGRHGARYLTNVEGLRQLIRWLSQGEEENLLTEEGKALKGQLIRLLPIEEGGEGLLTSSGYEMEKGIAQRMYQNNPEVFGRKVEAVSTYVTRTKQSMAAFLEALAVCTSSENFSAESYSEVDPILRFFDLNKAYIDYKTHGNWRRQLELFEARRIIDEGFIKRFFRVDGVNENILLEGFSSLALAKALYSVYANTYDLDSGKFPYAKKNMGKLFDEETLRYLWENENVQQYLVKGPSNVGQSQPTNIAFPLLMDFLNTSNKAIETRDYSANLRFAHAETIIPFTALLRLLGFFNQTNAMKQVAMLWQDYWVAPMAANLQWIFYEHPTKKQILIKMLYNESEVRLPIRSLYGPYYDFSTVRSFYIQQLRALRLNWQQPLVRMVEDYVQICTCC